jgi:hypothetical protein
MFVVSLMFAEFLKWSGKTGLGVSIFFETLQALNITRIRANLFINFFIFFD